MELNRRETHVLYVCGLILLAGGILRWIAASGPRGIPEPPGLRTAAEMERGISNEDTATGSDEPPWRARAPALERPSPLARADTLFAGDLIDLNAASPEELCLLPGIGPAMAGRVVELRRQRGRFSRVDELLDVRGIGPKTLAKLAPLVTVR